VKIFKREVRPRYFWWMAPNWSDV